VRALFSCNFLMMYLMGRRAPVFSIVGLFLMKHIESCEVLKGEQHVV